jgi:hypothetical protein
MLGLLLTWPVGWPSSGQNYDVIPVPEYSDETAARQEWAVLLNDLDREVVDTIERDGTTVALLVE